MNTKVPVGMQPGLEAPEYYPDFHATLLIDIRYALVPQLPDQYKVLVEGGLSMTNYVEEVKRFKPDVKIERPEQSVSSGVAVATKPVAVTAPDFILDPPVKPQRRLVLLDAENNLITTIEVLSPANKKGTGFTDFRHKQTALAENGINLVELDLLQKGKRRWPQEKAANAPYLITVHRAESSQVEAWSAAPGKALPAIPVPLRYDDGDVVINLEELVAGYLVKSGVGRWLDRSA